MPPPEKAPALKHVYDTEGCKRSPPCEHHVNLELNQGIELLTECKVQDIGPKEDRESPIYKGPKTTDCGDTIQR